MALFNDLPVYKATYDLLLAIFRFTKDFSKDYKYTVAAHFPFYSACDYKKWETQAAKDYFVSTSPTIFLLDSNNKIILRPPTVASLDSWLERNTTKMN